MLLLALASCFSGANSGPDVPSDAGPDAPDPDARPPVFPEPREPVDVHVTITADNAYGFGYGAETSLAHYFLGVEDGGGQIFFCSAVCDAQTPCPGDTTCDAFGT